MPTPLVSAIMANWNGAQDLVPCLSSLREQSYQPIEIIVVDNGSADESETVARQFEAHWVPLGKNEGLAPALNRGAAVAQGACLLFCNNDLRFHQDCVRWMVEELLKAEGIFAVDARQDNWEGTRSVHLATFLTATPVHHDRAIRFVPGLYTLRESKSTPTVVPLASGANMLVKQWMFHELGGFDERFFAGYEDFDLCWRAWLRGWTARFVPQARCWHRVASTSDRPDGLPIRFRATVTGRLVVATKLLPWEYLLRTWLEALVGLIRDGCAMRWGDVGVVGRWRALRDSLRATPSIFQERRRLYRSANSTPAVHLARLLRLAQEPS